MKSPRASLAALLTAQAQESFNDCAAKIMLGALAQQLARAQGVDPKPIVALIAILLVLPYILFGPVCGWLSDRFPKRTVLNWTLVAQVVVMLLLMLALWRRSFDGAIICFFLLCAETAVLAPAKRGILLEYVGPQKLSRWVGYMEMFNITAILAGSVAGGWLFSHWLTAGGDPWQAALNTAGVLTALAVFAWALFQVAQPTKAYSTEPFRWSLWVGHWRDVVEVWQARPLWRATMGICFFYGVGGYATVLLQQVGYEMTHGGPEAGAKSSLMMGMIGIGTMFGNLFAGLLSRRGVELGLAPIGGAMLAAVLIALGFTAPGTTQFSLLLVATGFSSGFLLVPLYAFVQEKAGDHRRGRILAGVALLDSIVGMAAYAIYVAVASDAALGWSVSTQFFLMAAVTLAMLAYGLYHLPHQTACTVMRLIGRIFYKVKVLGREHVPEGGALVLCNHLSYVDAVVLQIASPRPMRFVAFAGFAKSPVMRFLFRASGVIPVNPNKPLKGIRLAWEALQAGELVCIFPEGAISRTGQLMELRRGFETIVRNAKVPVVPAAIDGLWGSIYSFAGNRYLWKSPRLMPTPVCVVFGPPIASEQADVARMRKAMLDVGETAFQERPMLKRHLGREIVRSLAKRPGHVEIVDRTAERRPVKAAQLLAVAAALSRHIRKTIPEKRVGIVLPPGAGAHIVNLAIACADKIPVNLNFTAGKAAVEASLKLGEIKTVITADAMRAKVPNFPFPENTLDLKKTIEAAGGKKAIVPWLLAAWLLPNQWIANLLNLPKEGDHEEAALLFTSGSSGEPKGVVLTHRNIFANCAQISSLSILPDTAVLMACLPVFHSFGFTVTLWYPMLRGCKVVTVPSPLDTKKIVEAIQQEKATVMLGAPTFVRPFLKKATKEELASLDLVVTGAEKLTMDLYESFLGQFGIEILQGYGLTETTPATNINQHNPPITTSTAEEQLGKRTGSVGRLMPGMTARIVDPDTGAELPMNQTGMLWLKGANVFPGYLKDHEKTAAAIKDGGWFVTGDLGRFDDQGFLFIEGRLSRFSKIGGEMVPHGTIEQRCVDLLGLEQAEGPAVAITGIPDATKGEALVLLTTQDITLEQLRTKLLDSGLPNLWVPRILRRVEKIPMLGTGKTDLKGVRTLAMELTKEQGEA
jgi:acyl-[acyl-carrier-protein]-phospholipid O-acyltransferase/long-chain-fatty-acid--[acyl-carrier-protein] ligase